MNKKLIAYSIVIFVTGCIAIKPTERINFESPDLYPEGIAYDSTTGSFFVSSARLGSIGKVDNNGVYSKLVSDTSLKSSYGLKVHPDGKRLFACIGDANYSKYTSPDTRKKMIRLLTFDLTTGKKIWDIDLAGLVPGKHFGNDIAFDNEGNAYITDSYAHAIYKVDTKGVPVLFAKNKLFETEGIGLNGIVYHPSGYLLADNSNTGAIYKIDIRNPSMVSVVKIDQYFLGADGMLLNDANNITIVVNGGNDKIFNLKSEDNWVSAAMTASTLIADRFTYPSTATFKAKDIWVMNARFSELNDSNAVPSKKFSIQRAVLKPLPKSK